MVTETRGYIVISETQLKMMNDNIRSHAAGLAPVVIVDVRIINDKVMKVGKEKLVMFEGVSK